MKNINNKGFAISGIVYTIFLMFITILTIILMLLLNRKVILDKEKKSLLSELDGEASGEIIDLNKDGTEIYFDPEKGETCNTYTEANSATGIKKGCMKWYTFGGTDSGTMVNLLLDHNSTAATAWNTNNTNTDSSQIDAKVASDTSTWVAGLNPRLITADEIAKITKHPTFNSATTTSNFFYLDTNTTSPSPNTGPGTSKYAWVFDRTYQCVNTGCNVSDNKTYGYWTDTPLKGSNSAVWKVGRNGQMLSIGADSGDDASYASAYGIRPVITVSKTILK